MATILLAGGAGYIGSHTALELLEAGYEVVVADNLSNSSPESVRRVEKLTGKKLPLYIGDVRDAAFLDSVFSARKVDAVVHFAGLKAVGESVQRPLLYYDNNLNCTIELAKAMERHGVACIIFSSSATVYDMTQEMPLREDMRTGGCTNAYGMTKLMSEEILRDAARANGRLSVVLLRYFNPIGAHPSGRIGEDPEGIPNNLMPYISQVAVGRRERLHVFGDDYHTPDGTGVRDYIHVCDLARGHVAALGYALDKCGVEVFNLGSGRGSSVFDVMHAFERASGVSIPYDIAPRRGGDVDLYYASAEKALRVLGWKTECSLEDACRDAWNWQRNNPAGYGK